MNYSKEKIQLAQLVRRSSSTVSVVEASSVLNISRSKASKLLSHYEKNGWLMRIARGVYIPVPLGIIPPTMVNDPLVIPDKLFSPCYIGGWSAASHWGLTEQLYRSIIVMTQTPQRNYSPVIAGVQYLLHLVKPSRFYGLTSIWADSSKVQISDPTRTIIDLMLNPQLGGGIQSSVDIFVYYMNSKEKSVEKLIEYLNLTDVGAVYKRLGFLTEKYFPEEKKIIEICSERLTFGNAKLDSSKECTKLITKWRLLVSPHWKE